MWKGKKKSTKTSLIKDSKRGTNLSACCDSSNMCARNIWYTNPNKVNEVIATCIVDLLKGTFFYKLTRFRNSAYHLECMCIPFFFFYCPAKLKVPWEFLGFLISSRNSLRIFVKLGEQFSIHAWFHLMSFFIVSLSHVTHIRLNCKGSKLYSPYFTVFLWLKNTAFKSIVN